MEKPVVVDPEFRPRRAECGVFDFDGTVSLLRTGWQGVMEELMVEALGEASRERVRSYINESTGVQTILQMEWLDAEVRRLKGRSPGAKALKDEYDGLMLTLVGERSRGGGALIVPGAVEFLNGLKERGLQLHLASGTDRTHVIDEARFLGVDGLFGPENIHGAVGDVSLYSKKKLFAELLGDEGLSPEGLFACGDGPVEMRVAAELGAARLGVASNENSPGEWNEPKRARLARAGAQVLVPDFRAEGLLELFAG